MYSLDVTTSFDAQEAMSRNYCTWGILKLTSGRYAIYKHHKLIAICDDPREVDLSFQKTSDIKSSYVARDGLPSLDSVLSEFLVAPKPKINPAAVRRF